MMVQEVRTLGNFKKEKDTLHFNKSHRISEEDIVDHISTIYYQSNVRWVSKYCNKIDITMNTDKLQHSISSVVKHKKKESRPIFRLNVKIELSDIQ